MSGERNPRRDMEPSDNRPTDLARRVALLSAQRPTPAAQFCAVPRLPSNTLSPLRMEPQADG
jgi:hypothetical protein